MQICQRMSQRGGAALEFHLFNWTGSSWTGWHYDPLVRVDGVGRGGGGVGVGGGGDSFDAARVGEGQGSGGAASSRDGMRSGLVSEGAGSGVVQKGGREGREDVSRGVESGGGLMARTFPKRPRRLRSTILCVLRARCQRLVVRSLHGGKGSTRLWLRACVLRVVRATCPCCHL